ncbi:Inactive peptidyl-prolyl cis-trans isomerase fkbp6 [Desmophyllum pertusum]|uniref:peptidylprolyl isomerase n=1 Tax=Desmophyllum pertusum TaxID=174260 RepID=A0A9W9ZC40_9CNID|nr:Inactive peptidyl-prolyl cis-trans isomerase fkbp6 [Desmophyllum pertusum]
MEQEREEQDSMDAPEVIDSLEDLALAGRDGYVPNRYTVPLRQAIDINDLVQGDGTMFETDLDNMAAFEEEESQYFDSEDIFQQLNYECNDFGDDSGSDKDEDVTPFKRLARGMEDLTGDGGVLKRIGRQGTGPVVPRGATIRYHINGYIEFNDEPFDSSRLRNRPDVKKLDEIIPGLYIGISTMRKGEKSKFLLSPLYAFKELGIPPRVPPSATVLYEVELLSYIDHKAADDFDAFTEEERKQATFEQLLKVANSERENADQERWMNEVLLKLYLNAAHCYLELVEVKKVLTYARKALGIDPRNVKALYRMGKAYMKQGEFDSARDKFKKAQHYEPNNKAIKDALIELDRKVSQFNAIEKQTYSRMFSTAKKVDGAAKDEKSAQTSVNLAEEKKEVLVKRLRQFKEDSSSKEICFPATLTQQERACIKLTAQEMGLKVEGKEGTNKELKVIKESCGEDAPSC